MDWGQSMKRLLHSNILKTPVLAVALGAVGLSGCTSLRGTQESALFSSMAALEADQEKTSTLREYSREKLVTYDGKTNANEQQQYRNQSIAVFMDAIDENYHTYSSRLFSEGLQFALGFEGAIVGLAATAALFPNSAPELASVIAAAGGGQATVNKNMYFDRTLPALITTMDARRIRIETEILAKLKLPVSKYPIEFALRDLRHYQNAGTLFRAIADVTGTAAEQKKDAEDERYSGLTFGCDPSKEIILAGDPLRRFVLKQRAVITGVGASLAEKKQAESKMRIIANNMGLKASDPTLLLIQNVARTLAGRGGKYCRATELLNLQETIESVLGEKL